MFVGHVGFVLRCGYVINHIDAIARPGYGVWVGHGTFYDGDPMVFKLLAILPFCRCIPLREDTHVFTTLRARKSQARTYETGSTSDQGRQHKQMCAGDSIADQL